MCERMSRVVLAIMCLGCLACQYEEAVVDTPNGSLVEDPELCVTARYPQGTLAFLTDIDVTTGRDYVDITVHGAFPGSGFELVRVLAVVLGHEIVLVPVAEARRSGTDAFTPFQETIRVSDLELDAYIIYAIGGPSGHISETVILRD